MFKHLISFIFISVLCYSVQPAYGDVLVRVDVQQDATISYVDLRLFEDVAPLTVENFLNYVHNTTTNGGNYDNSFIHRSAEAPVDGIVVDFIIQGGGFTFDPTVNDGSFIYDEANDTFPGGLQKVPADPAIQNEFNKSNVRGTIAMAKLGGDPNSATSQWFINLKDNSLVLGTQNNGGFTVFGEVLSDGMTVVDEIASQITDDRTDIHSAFGELPLINFTTDPIQQENLVRINTMTELLSISADIDFKPVLLNTSPQTDIIIENTGSASHSIGDIASTDVVNVPFSIIVDECSNTTLLQGEECNLSVQFSPQSENIFNDTFNIELTDLALSFSFALKGEGVLTPPAPDITPSLDIVDFGEVQLFNELIGIPEQILITFNNDGNLDLNVTSMTLGGADEADFEIFDNCITSSPMAAGGFCTLALNFKPLTVGNRSATLTVVSDDPDESPLIIPITGTASIDTDGVPASIEDAAPNDGDGNNDGVLDSIQNNAASLPGVSGSYISLVTSAGARISDIAVLSSDQLVSPPDNVQFNLGILDFKIDNIQVGGTVEVGLILPLSTIPVTYYMYGPTPDNTNPHWYEFLYDGTTGAQLIGQATITSPDGVNIERNLIKLVFIDGGRGDTDLSANGVIIDPGAPVVTSSSTSSGSLSMWSLFYLTAILVLLRQTRRRVIPKPKIRVSSETHLIQSF